MNKLTNGTVNH